MNALARFVGESFSEFGQIKRYLFVGFTNTATTYALYLILLFFVVYEIAYSISFLTGMVLSYAGHARFTFGTQLSVTRAIAYVLACLFNYFLGLVLLIFFVEALGIHEGVASLLVISLTVQVNFILARAVLTISASQV